MYKKVKSLLFVMLIAELSAFCMGNYNWKADRDAIVDAINNSDSESFKNVFKKMEMYWAKKGEFLFLEDNPSLGTTKQMVVLPNEKKIVEAVERFDRRATNIYGYCLENYWQSQLDVELKKKNDAQLISSTIVDFKKKIKNKN